jgi:acyl-CoA oxidase
MALIEERKANSLNLEELTSFIYSYACRGIPLPRIRELRDKMCLTPGLTFPISHYHHTRENAFIHSLKFGKAWLKFLKAENLSLDEMRISYENFSGFTTYRMHYAFFLPSFLLQANRQQRDEWQQKIENMEIIGSYAQTELAHGSNVRGLETTATYDHGTKSFVLHSPTVGSTKWWIGALGLASNHTLVIAQLIVNGNSYGPHPFLVPLRNIETHEPLSGVDVGDIGPKMGINGLDNGYVRFDNYRIPKKYMLARFSAINDAGEYEVVDPNGIKIMYLSLVRARIFIFTDAWFPLSCALTIAIRYSLVRKQFPDPKNPTEELKILDYQVQQKKLFSTLGLLYAITFARVSVWEIFEKVEQDVIAGGSPSLDLIHCLVCMYKAFASNKVLEAIETCRRSCGGHGFMMISGLSSLYTGFVPAVTVDGDNTVLSLQVIRYLVSLFHKKPPKEFQYLTAPILVPTGDPLSANFQQQCFMAVAHYKVNRVFKRFQELNTHIKKEEIWNNHLQVEGVDAVEPVVLAHLHSKFLEAVDSMNKSENKEAVESLRTIFVGSEIQRYAGVLIGLGVSTDCLEIMNQAMIAALGKVRKNALGLIEAYEVKDEALQSILGRKDGKVYENMIFHAKNENPLNKTRVFPGIREMLRPKL